MKDFPFPMDFDENGEIIVTINEATIVCCDPPEGEIGTPSICEIRACVTHGSTDGANEYRIFIEQPIQNGVDGNGDPTYKIHRIYEGPFEPNADACIAVPPAIPGLHRTYFSVGVECRPTGEEGPIVEVVVWDYEQLCGWKRPVLYVNNVPIETEFEWNNLPQNQ